MNEKPSIRVYLKHELETMLDHLELAHPFSEDEIDIELKRRQDLEYKILFGD